MQKIERTELAKAAVAGGCCKCCCSAPAKTSSAKPSKPVATA